MSSSYPPCINCGNIDFEDENGILVCTNCGRQQEGGAQQTGEDDEHFAPGKVTKRKLDRTKTKTSRIYRGAKAYRLYLQAWQHILWKQVHVFCHGDIKLPTELWTVVKDVWTLMVSRSVSRFETPSIETGNLVTETHDIEVARDTDTTLDTTTDGVRSQILTPKLLDTISLIYIACVLLHLPLSVHKLHDLVITETIPFIRAIRHVPYEMSSKLPSEHQLALDTTTIPSAKDIHQNIFQLADELHKHFNLVLPTLNWKPLLLLHLQDLDLPTEIYPAVQGIAAMAGFDFSYKTRDKQDLDDSAIKPRTRRRISPLAWPETQLLSLIVIAANLLFPLTPHTSSTHTNPQFSWSAWATAARNNSSDTSANSDAGSSSNSNNNNDKFIRPAQLRTADLDTASPTNIDKYLSWYEHMWTLQEEALVDKLPQLEREIIDTFSHIATPSTTTTTAQTPASVHSTTDSRSQTAFPPASPVSTAYSLSSPADQDHISIFHSLVARNAATDLPHLLRAVSAAEGRLERCCREQTRKEVFEDARDQDVDVEMSEDDAVGSGMEWIEED